MKTTNCNVVVFAPMYPPAFRGGGPIRSLEALVAQAPDDFDVSVVTSDRDIDGVRLAVKSNVWMVRNSSRVKFVSSDSSRAMLRGLRSALAQESNILYFNSFFNFSFSILPQFLSHTRAHRKTIRLVAPRGEFNSAALSRRSSKKRLYIALYRALGLHRRTRWHASSELEANDIRGIWGPAARVLVRPNETSLPTTAQGPPPPMAVNDVLSAVFLGRIVEHKGLDLALEALHHVEHPLRLTVYGTEEDPAYLADCRRIAGALPTHVSVRFAGVLRPPTVRTTLSEFDVLLMPTRGENFGHVIAEALSVSCPVVCSDTTPWSATLRSGGGAVVRDRDPQSWGAAIDLFASISAETRRKRRDAAGVAYDSWRRSESRPHVFDLARALPA